MKVSKPEKVADALRTLGHQHGMQHGGDNATVRLAEVAKATHLSTNEVTRILVEEAHLVWGKLPMGWMHRVGRDGTVQLTRKRAQYDPESNSHVARIDD